VSGQNKNTRQMDAVDQLSEVGKRENDELNLYELWRIVFMHKRLVFVVVISCLILSLIAAIVITPVYRANILLAPTVDKAGKVGRLGGLASQFGGLAQLAGVSLTGGDNIETAIATLKSRQFITGFIRDSNIKPILFPEQWDSENQKWFEKSHSIVTRLKQAILPDTPKVMDSANKPLGEPSMWEAYKLFNDRVLTVIKKADTGLVTVNIEWSDPSVAAIWGNSIVKRLNSELRNQTIKESEKSIIYLQEQIEQTSVADLRAVLYRLVEEHTKNMTLAKVNEQYALKVIDPAVPPHVPVKPRRLLIVILGLFFGFVLGVFVALVRNTLRAQQVSSSKANPESGVTNKSERVHQ